MTDLNRIQADENLRLGTDVNNLRNNESLLAYSETENCQRTENRYDADPRIVLFGWRLRLATGKSNLLSNTFKCNATGEELLYVANSYVSS